MPDWPQILLVDDELRDQFLPLSFTRPVAHFRFGIRTMQEKWDDFTGTKTSPFPHPFLSDAFQLRPEAGSILINARICPDAELVNSITGLGPGQSLTGSDGKREDWIATRCLPDQTPSSPFPGPGDIENPLHYPGEYLSFSALWHLFGRLDAAIVQDFERMTAQTESGPLPSTNTVIGDHPVYLAPGARAEASVFNTTNGPVYLGPDSEVMEGCHIRGPFALGAKAVLKMAAKVYGATSLGPYVKLGGEVNNSLIFGYSNKAHDGFLGNSVIGEWCNLGADTNNSNLKNNYGPVRIWNYPAEDYQSTGLQFCGLVMGDHSKAGINTMFNTGTVVGVSANVYGSGFPPKFIPSFSWGGADGLSTYRLDKALEVAASVMARRNIELSEADKALLGRIFKATSGFRTE